MSVFGYNDPVIAGMDGFKISVPIGNEVSTFDNIIMDSYFCRKQTV